MQDKKMAIDFAELVPGSEFPPTSYKLSAPLIAKYLKAVDITEDLKLWGGFVPPLAIAAYAMTAMAGSFSLPPGSIHASQEFEFFQLVPVGSTINCHAKVARKLTRGRIYMLVLEFNVFNQSGEKVQSGKATIVLPTN